MHRARLSLILTLLLSACGTATTSNPEDVSSEVFRDSFINKGKMLENACNQLNRTRDSTGLLLNAATSWKDGATTSTDALTTIQSTNTKIALVLAKMIDDSVAPSSTTDLESAKALHKRALERFQDCSDFITNTLKASTKLDDATFALLQNSCAAPYKNYFDAYCEPKKDTECARIGRNAATTWVDEVDFLSDSEKCNTFVSLKKRYDDLLTPSDSEWSCDVAYNEAVRETALPVLKDIKKACDLRPTPAPTSAPVPVPTSAPVLSLTDWQRQVPMYLSSDGWILDRYFIGCEGSAGSPWSGLAYRFVSDGLENIGFEGAFASKGCSGSKDKVVLSGEGTYSKYSMDTSAPRLDVCKGSTSFDIDEARGVAEIVNKRTGPGTCKSTTNSGYKVTLKRATEEDVQALPMILPPEVDAFETWVVTTTNLNCRATASLNAEVVTVLQPDVLVKRMAREDRGYNVTDVKVVSNAFWYQFDVPGNPRNCWIRGTRSFLAPF